MEYHQRPGDEIRQDRGTKHTDCDGKRWYATGEFRNVEGDETFFCPRCASRGDNNGVVMGRSGHRRMYNILVDRETLGLIEEAEEAEAIGVQESKTITIKVGGEILATLDFDDDGDDNVEVSVG